MMSIAGRALGRALGRAGWLRSARSLWACSEARYADLQVSVPPLGESITDGAIAAIIKQPGDLVEEDEALLSIETDKVTVDVRTPVSGVVKSILVSQDDSIEVGRVVAVVSEGEGRGKVEAFVEHVVERRETSGLTSSTVASREDVAAAERSMERTLTPPPVPESERVVMVSANGHGRAHMPSISFPTRRTADGRMISGMSEDDQKRIRNEELSVLHSASFFLRNMEGGGGAARAPPLWRRPMTDREMESIMLGGAE